MSFCPFKHSHVNVNPGLNTKHKRAPADSLQFLLADTRPVEASWIRLIWVILPAELTTTNDPDQFKSDLKLHINYIQSKKAPTEVIQTDYSCTVDHTWPYAKIVPLYPVKTLKQTN